MRKKSTDRVSLDGRGSNTRKRVPTADEQVIYEADPDPFQRVLLLSALRYKRILQGLPTYY